MTLPQYSTHVRERGTAIHKPWIRSKGPCCSRLTGLIVSARDSHGVQSLCRDTEVATGVFRKVWRCRIKIGWQKEPGSKLGYGPLEWPLSLISGLFTDYVDVLN